MTFDRSTADENSIFAPKDGCEFQLLIADNQILVRDALRPELRKLADVVRIFECGTFEEAVQLAATSERLAMAILALRMPGMNGVEGVRDFRARFPEIPLVVMSGYYSGHEVLAAFEHGAAGFISMAVTLDSVVHALRLILSGVRHFPSEALDALRGLKVDPTPGKAGDFPRNPLDGLTLRERDVLSQLVEGHANKVIARNLGVQEVTVKLHVGNLLRKFGAANRTQAVKIALQLGWRADC